MKEIIIDKTNEKQRLDKYLKRILPEASNSFIYKMLRKKNIELNSKRAKGDEILKAGDSVKLFFSDDTYLKMTKHTDIDSDEYLKAFSQIQGITVVFEHTDFLVINKPSGVLSQKDDSGKLSVNEWGIGYLLKNGSIDEESLAYFKPSVLNRLDMNTRGLLIIGKTLTGSRRISEMLKKRTIHKYYRAKVDNGCSLNGEYSAYISKNSKTNKVTVYADSDEIPANLKYSLIKTGIYVSSQTNDDTFLDIELITGKSHQIRAHLAFLGFPIKGDIKYGYKGNSEVHFQDLKAYKIVFPSFDENDDWYDLNNKIISIK